jgi:hypothetical protein
MKRLIFPLVLTLASAGLGGWFGFLHRPQELAPARQPVKRTGAERPASSAVRKAGSTLSTLLEKALRWEKADAATILRELTESGADSAGRTLAEAAFLQRPAEERLAALLAEAKLEANSGTLPRYIFQTMQEMVVKAPADVARLLRTQKLFDKAQSTTIVEALWAASGLNGVEAFMQILPQDAHGCKLSLGPAFLRKLAETDLAAAVKRALAITNHYEKQRSMSAIATYMAAKDPAAALDWLAANHMPSENHSMSQFSPVAAVMDDLAQRDPAAAAALLAKADGILQKDTYNLGSYETVKGLLFAWMSKDAAAAQAWMKSGVLNDRLQLQVDRSAAELAMRDLKGPEKFAYFKKLPPSLMESGAHVFLQQLSATDLTEGVRALHDSLSESNRSSFMYRLRDWLPKLQGDQRAEALALLEKHPDITEVTQLSPEDLSQLSPASQAKFKSSQAEAAMSIGDIEKARELVQEIAPEHLSSGIAASMATRMIDEDPAAAASWVETLPAGNARDGAVENLAANWAKVDPAAAAAWVQKLPLGSAKDDALASVAQLHGQVGDAAAALALAASIGKDSIKHQAFADAVRSQWFRDPAAAEALLTAQGVGAADLPAIRKNIEQGPNLR